MNFEKAPQLFTPAYNPVLWVISSTFSEVLYFNLALQDVSTNGRVVNDKAYVSPVTPTSTHYNISDIARDLVKWEIINDGSRSAQITDSVRQLRLSGSDQGVVGLTMCQLGATATAPDIFVWNGQLPRHKFTDYAYQDWVVDGGVSKQIKFLTYKPNYSLVNNYSREFLYYLKVDSFMTQSIKITSYTCGGATISQILATASGTASMVRLDVSPKSISLTNPTFFSGSPCYYSVQLFKNNYWPISEKKFFKYTPDPDCGQDIVNIFWENELGGIDSYQFIQPVETRTVERFQIKKNPWQYDVSGTYDDREQMVYNQEERVIHNNLNTTWQMWTRVMTTEENSWIGGLVHSRNWWVELKNGRVYPCTLVESTYRIENQKYLTNQRIQSQWTFNFVDELIRDGQIYAGTASIPTTTSTTTTTTTVATTTTTSTSTETTTSAGTTTTTTSTSTETTTVATYYEFTGCGRGTSTSEACTDAVTFNRTFWSDCSTLASGCTIYVDDSGTTPLLYYTHIYIGDISWRISQTNGKLQYVDVTQC
jgi:hypothetical protein